MDVLIREVQSEDAEAIVGILNRLIETGKYTAFDTPLSTDTERTYIQNFPKRGIFHVAVRCLDRKIVGFQTMMPFVDYSFASDHVGVIGTYVDLAYHRQGIAKRLFAVTYEVAKSKEYKKIFTQVRADNWAGLAAYLSQGFRIVGTAQRHIKIKDKYIDDIIIEKFL